MMECTNGILQQVEEYAYLYMFRSQIALITGVDEYDLRDALHPVGIAFLKGRLKRKAEFNGAVIKLTKQLSSPAMALEQKLAEQAALNDMKS